VTATVEAMTLQTPDGIALEAELSPAIGPVRAGTVLCHPHPQYRGTMRSIVIGALFNALPSAGVTCLRFNYRGVENSGGTYDEGKGERVDAVTAVSALAATLPAAVPLVLTGWSFGADIALSVREPAVSAWLAIAPPLSFADDVDATGRDPRPKLVALAEHDEFRDPSEVAPMLAGWTATQVETVAGASHFFVGRTDRLVEIAVAYIERLTS
jgi:alpha/beta superfamily hydrolase